MKKIFYLTLALPLALATSCSNDDMPAPGTDGMTTFSVKMPAELSSRAFNDGKSAKNLAVAVYDENDNLLYSNIAGEGSALPEGAVIGNFADGLTTTVTLPLVKGKEYNVAFWAYADNAPYTFTPSEKKITVDYTGASANDENRDGFFKYQNVPSERPATNSVELRRPFAQVNIGTSDLEIAQTAGLTVSSANITFPAGALATTFNFIDGTADTPNSEAVTFTGTSLPSDNFPVQPETYKYLAMAYVLTPVSDATSPKSVMQSVALAVNGNDFSSYANVPVQGNYQTNIYGALLTKKENFTVTINPAFTGSYIEEQPVQTIDSSDPDEVKAALEKGGNFLLTGNIEALDLSGLSRTATTKITVKGTVGSINPGTKAANPAELIINVPKDVAYPEFVADKVTDWKNITIEGDLSSSERCPGIIFKSKGTKVIENLTVTGVPFEGQGIDFNYVATPSIMKNLRVVGCDFANMTQPFINGGNNQTPTTVQADIEILNNHVVYASSGVNRTASGIYLTQSTGNILIEGNVIEKAPYHAIFITPSPGTNGSIGYMSEDELKNSQVIVRNNTVSAQYSSREGIKIDSPYGNTLITGNKILNGGIRVDRFNSAWIPTVTISYNYIAGKGRIYVNPFEDNFTGTAVINIFGNTGSNRFTIATDFTPAAGSDYSQPFAN